MKRRRVYTIMVFFLVMTCCTIGGRGSVSALTYQDSADIEFTFASSLSVSISGANDGDLAIPSLTPGSTADSNEVLVTVDSNALNGYSLQVKAGSSSNDTANLVNGSSVMTPVTSSVASMSSAGTSTWGYAYASYASSACGDYSNYLAMPKYSESAATIFSTSSSSGEQVMCFKIGARASDTQIAGEYANTINFYVVSN